jgi:hypothetical protein
MGTMTLELNNRDARFDPNNTGSPHSPNVRIFTPIRFRATENAITYDLFYGFASSWPQEYPGMKNATVTVECVDGFQLMQMFEAELTESQEVSGTRIGNLLDTMSWPAGLRDIDTGGHNVAALVAEFDSVLGEIDRTALVESGWYWIAGDGDFTFRDGNTRIQDEASSNATYTDAAAGLQYTQPLDLVPGGTDEQLWNKAVVTREGGTAQTVSDASSIGDFGERDLHLSETLHVSDGEARSLADQLIDEFKDPRASVPTLTFQPQSDTNLWAQALGRELLERVTVTKTGSGDTFSEDFHISGISHTVGLHPREWLAVFELVPVLPHTDWWILGTAQLGTATRLGY